MAISPALTEIKYLSENPREGMGRAEQGGDSRSGWREGKSGEEKVKWVETSWLGKCSQDLELN